MYALCFEKQIKHLLKNYQVRIRYASKGINSLIVRGDWLSYAKQSTEDTFQDTQLSNLTYENFQYININTRININDITTRDFHYIFLENQTLTPNNMLIIDKIEIIPITQQYLETSEKEKVETVQKSINNLFINQQKQYLKTETTDYEIDQVAISIKCMSDKQQYTQENMLWWDEVKHAKYLSHSRNLLQNGDFEDVFNGWTTSKNIFIHTDNSTFKGKYLHMYGARDIDGTLFPTYIYQKIDESKLKPYTRYQIRGFVGSSKELKLMVIRYGKEIDTIMNVPNDIPYVPSMLSCNELYNSEQSLYQKRNVDYYNQMPEYTFNTYQCIPDQKQAICHDSHQFKFHIDIGEVDYNTNLGMLVLFKISSPDGYATLGNLEVIEEGPITGEALVLVKQKEKKWNQHMEKKRMDTKQAYDRAKEAVDALFTGEELNYNVTLSQIKNADQLVQSIPYIHNIQGLQGWHAEGKVEIQQMNRMSVLVLSNWSSGVSQNLHVQHQHGYVLRVSAKKEGPGKGYVTMMGCNGRQETLMFTPCDGGYMTKTLEVFLDTDRIRIEIGETEGSFYIESIELNCVKGYNNEYN
ncbi:pesticidial crystal protein [Bacillus cereus]|nr:pesticidial crystal protein [Bacillus cereus]